MQIGVELDAPTLEALFHHYDMDGNGVLVYDEVLALCASMKQGDAEVRKGFPTVELPLSGALN